MKQPSAPVVIEAQSGKYQVSRGETILRRRASHLFGGGLAVLVLGLFMGFIFNRYLTIHEGWFYYYAWLVHKGQMPYRDFWFFCQPISLFLAKLFGGTHIINLRIFGLVERIALSGMLYFLLSRQFSPKASFLATVVSTMVFLSYLTEGFFTYLVDSLVFLVAGFICVYESWVHPRHHKWILLLAGVSGSLCFFSKQSTGLFGTFALALLIAWPERDVRRIINKLVSFSVGWCVAAAPILIWLVRNGAWNAYLTEVYKGAVASKGTFRTIFITAIHRTLLPKDVAVLVLILALLGLATRKKWLVFQEPQERTSTRATLVLTAAVALLVIFGLIVFRLDEPAVQDMRRYIFVFSKVIFMGMALQVAWIIVRRLRSDILIAQPVTPILIIGGFLWGYGCQLSYRVEQHAIVLGLAFLVAFACDNISSRSGKSLAGIATVLCLLQVGESALYKYNDAYDWTGWRSTISLSSTKASAWPQLAGFRVHGSTVYIVDSILDDIVRFSKPGEPIFTFPTMPMFNYITGHPQPTFAPVHTWDICPDYIAEADAVRLKAARPAVIVYMDMPVWLWQDGELAFREGRRSGQRDIKAVIDNFASSGDYQLLQTFVTPVIDVPIRVYRRLR